MARKQPRHPRKKPRRPACVKPGVEQLEDRNAAGTLLGSGALGLNAPGDGHPVLPAKVGQERGNERKQSPPGGGDGQGASSTANKPEPGPAGRPSNSRFAAAAGLPTDLLDGLLADPLGKDRAKDGRGR